jgi:hypothetical protein
MNPESEHAYKPERLKAEYDAYISDYRQAVIWRRRCIAYAGIAGLELLLLLLIFVLR